MVFPQRAMADCPHEVVRQKMVEGDPGGQMAMVECLCIYAVADAVLDDDIKTHLFEFWYTGDNVTKMLKALPQPKRVQ